MPDAEQSDGALRFESPIWLKAAWPAQFNDNIKTPVIDLTEIGDDREHIRGEYGPGEDLQAVLARVDPQTEILHLADDAPNNDEWEALGQHFTNVRYLHVATGFDESWIDDKFPLTWPLKLLVISDSCGERINTPVILEGRVEHLVLLYTTSLRFEGPTTDQLMEDATDLSDESSEFAIYSISQEFSQWFRDKYRGKRLAFDSSTPEGMPPSRMKKLEILGNDALEMLTHFALARFHVLASIESLTLHSDGGSDLSSMPTIFLSAFLPRLSSLKQLKMTLGADTVTLLLEATHGQPFLHRYLPPNLETFHFRGPGSMVPQTDAIASAFQKDGFLPLLKRISVVLDLPESDTGQGSSKEKMVPLEQLMAAKRACRRLFDAAAARGVMIEEFQEPWSEVHPALMVDSRWAGLDREP